MPPWMTSLLREDVPVPMASAFSATTTSAPRWAARASCCEADHAGADHQNLHAAVCLTRTRRRQAAKIELQ